MAIFISQPSTFKTKNLKTRKWQYLVHFSWKWKNNTTLFSSTLKVEENKVVLFFHFKLKWARYGNFYISQPSTFKTKNLKKRKWQYLVRFSLKWKNNTTLFSSTLKVEEIKWSYFFILSQIERDTANFLFTRK